VFTTYLILPAQGVMPMNGLGQCRARLGDSALFVGISVPAARCAADPNRTLIGDDGDRLVADGI